MELKRRLGEAMRRIRSSQRLQEDFAALCACGGRFAGTASEARARALLATRLAEATGAPTRRERVPYRGWTRGAAHLRLPDGRCLPALGLVRTPSTPPGGLSARLLDLGRGTPAEVTNAGDAVRDAIVLVRHEFMMGGTHVHRRRKYEAARDAGAAGIRDRLPRAGRAGSHRLRRRRRGGAHSGGRREPGNRRRPRRPGGCHGRTPHLGRVRGGRRREPVRHPARLRPRARRAVGAL